MAETILILGNGFDIAMGRKTKYTDFIEFEKQLFSNPDEKLQEFLKGKNIRIEEYRDNLYLKLINESKTCREERRFKGNWEIRYVGEVFGLHRLFFYKISSRKKKIILLKVLLLCYNRNDMILRWIRLEDNHVETKL